MLSPPHGYSCFYFAAVHLNGEPSAFEYSDSIMLSGLSMPVMNV